MPTAKKRQRIASGTLISFSHKHGILHCHELVQDFRMKKKIFITVTGGCAYVMEDTVPPGFVAEIIDFDNIEAGDDFPSDEARDYCIRHNLYQSPRTQT